MGLVLVTVLAAGTVLGVSAHRLEQASRDVRDRLQPASLTAEALLGHLIDQETGARGYVITGNPAYLQPYDTGRQAAEADLTRLRTFVRPGERDLLVAIDRVDTAARSWRTKAADPEIALRRTAGLERAIALVAAGQDKAVFDQLRGRTADLQGMLARKLVAAQERTRLAAEVQRDAQVVTGALIVAICMATLYLLRRWILLPVLRLRAALARVSSGDLAARVVPDGPPELAELGRDAEAMRRRIVSELEDARAAREALEQRGPVVAGLRDQLEPSRLPDLPGLRVAGALHVAEGVLAGDWYDVLTLPSGSVALVVSDVSGHGAEAGLVTARIKHQLTSALRLALAPHEALTMVAQGFSGELERFASCVVVQLDPDTGQGWWANAGHEPPLLIPAGDGAIDPDAMVELPPTGPVLSSLTAGGGGTWTSEPLRLDEDALLLAFTDGLVEARDDAGAEFGVDGIVRALELGISRDPDTVVSSCLAAAQAHARNWRRDDVTLVALRRRPVEPAAGAAEAAEAAGAEHEGAQQAARSLRVVG